MNTSLSAQFSYNGKTLTLFCAAINDRKIPVCVQNFVDEAFKNLSPYIQKDNQILYIRDIPDFAIKHKFPGGHCYNPSEAMIALVSWDDDEQQIKATINHELHHMARWQNPGYGETLGGAILSEGIATYYEQLQSGWLSPWAKAEVSKQALSAVLKTWSDKSYNHNE